MLLEKIINYIYGQFLTTVSTSENLSPFNIPMFLIKLFHRLIFIFINIRNFLSKWFFEYHWNGCWSSYTLFIFNKLSEETNIRSNLWSENIFHYKIIFVLYTDYKERFFLIIECALQLNEGELWVDRVFWLCTKMLTCWFSTSLFFQQSLLSSGFPILENLKTWFGDSVSSVKKCSGFKGSVRFGSPFIIFKRIEFDWYYTKLPTS